MKKIAFLLLFITNVVNSQENGIIKYNFTFEKLESKNIKDKDKLETMFLLMNKTIESLENGEFVLKFNNEKSYFTCNLMSIDDKFSLAGKGNFNDFKDVFSNSKIHELQYLKNIFGKDYLVNIPRSNFTLYEDFKNINEIKVQKAIIIMSEKNYAEVWFSNDYKVPFGPSIFYGLPGLVLEVTVYTNDVYKYTYKAQNINFNLNNIEIKDKPINLEIKNADEVQKIYKDARKDMKFKN